VFCENPVILKCNRFCPPLLLPSRDRVRATNYLGLGPGIVASEQSVALPTAPQSPTATVSGPLTLLVQWSAPVSSGVGDLSRPLLSYTLQRSHGDDSFAVGTTVDTVLSSTTTSQTITFDAASSTLYYFRIFTTNDAGDGALSDVASEQVLSPHPSYRRVFSSCNT
jgi:hypothetical protein